MASKKKEVHEEIVASQKALKLAASWLNDTEENILKESLSAVVDSEVGREAGVGGGPYGGLGYRNVKREKKSVGVWKVDETLKRCIESSKKRKGRYGDDSHTMWKRENRLASVMTQQLAGRGPEPPSNSVEVQQMEEEEEGRSGIVTVNKKKSMTRSEMLARPKMKKRKR